MALARIVLRPGIDKQNTEYGAEGGWIDGDYIRFRYGLPEKMGGWTKFNNSGVGLLGQATDIITWNDLDGVPYMALGTTRKLYAYTGGQYFDITPLRYSSTGLTFSTEDASDIVTVNDALHGALTGDFVTIKNVTGDPGGIPNSALNNEFQIQEVVDPNSYKILVPAVATSTALAAGDGDADYQIHVGQETSFFDFGWGVSSWGFGPWGAGSSANSEVSLYSRVWKLDMYGEDLVAQICDGPIYLWDKSLGGTTRATPIAGAPTRSWYALVSTPDRHLVCFGTEATVGSPATQDPMFVRFSSQENIGQFQESATNTAGGQRLTDGSRIVSAVRSRGQILIFTDTSLHGMQYIGPPFTFGFQQLGANCGCIGPHAAIDVNGIAFWMGKEAFYAFDGTVKKMPSTVQDFVFKDINLVQAIKVHAGLNTAFNEVTWWYCSFTSDFIDRFVTYNYLENTWHIGTMARTVWEDYGAYLKPIAADYSEDSNAATISTIYGLQPGRSFVYNQEDGLNGDGQPINAYIQSGYFDISEGDNMLLMSRFIPDFKEQLGNLTVRLLLRPYPQATASPSSLDPYVITPTTQKVDTRARGRQISLTIESDEIDTRWRYGTLRVDVTQDGLR
jgi:hypothetical protein